MPYLQSSELKQENLRIAFKENKVGSFYGKKFKWKSSYGVFLKNQRHNMKIYLLYQSPPI